MYSLSRGREKEREGRERKSPREATERDMGENDDVSTDRLCNNQYTERKCVRERWRKGEGGRERGREGVR